MIAKVDAKNLTEPTLIAFMVYVIDLAGSVRKSRVTAFFSPLGYAPAALTVDGDPVITSAAPVSMTNVLKAANGTSYNAPYVWQSVVNTIQVRV